jgi:hypothetical protein
LGELLCTGASTSTWRCSSSSRTDVAVGGVADHPFRTSVLTLLVDQLTGMVPVLVAGRERDRRQDWYRSVGGSVQLVTGELR